MIKPLSEWIKLHEEGKTLEESYLPEREWETMSLTFYSFAELRAMAEQDRIRVKPKEPVVLTVMVKKNAIFMSGYQVASAFCSEDPKWEGWEPYEITLRGDHE